MHVVPQHLSSSSVCKPSPQGKQQEMSSHSTAEKEHTECTHTMCAQEAHSECAHRVCAQSGPNGCPRSVRKQWPRGLPAENSAHSVTRAGNDAGVRTECIQHYCAESVLRQCVQGKQQRMCSRCTAENSTENAHKEYRRECIQRMHSQSVHNTCMK